jgi:hypothetical protein
MRTKRSISGLVAVFSLASVALVVSAQGIEPQAAADGPFWERPVTTIDWRSLSGADVKLVAGPDMRRGMILLQTGDNVPVADFVPTRADLAGLVPEKDAGYAIIPKGLVIGATPFGDRKYKLSKLPKGCEELTLLQTKMGHKAVIDATYSITVLAAKPCLVFLALDQRVIDTYKQHGTPSWLLEYEPTGETMKSDEPVMTEADAAYLLFVRKSAGGRIVLGPPSMDIQFNSMYFAFFGEAKGEGGR